MTFPHAQHHLQGPRIALYRKGSLILSTAKALQTEILLLKLSQRPALSASHRRKILVNAVAIKQDGTLL